MLVEATARARPDASLRFSGVLVNYNGLGWTVKALESVLAQRHPLVEAIVVDSGSTDGSVAEIEAWIAAHGDLPARLLPFEENIGFAAGCNRAFEVARGELLYLLNNDAETQGACSTGSTPPRGGPNRPSVARHLPSSRQIHYLDPLLATWSERLGPQSRKTQRRVLGEPRIPFESPGPGACRRVGRGRRPAGDCLRQDARPSARIGLRHEAPPGAHVLPRAHGYRHDIHHVRRGALWARAYPYARLPLSQAAQEAGFTLLLRPQLEVALEYRGASESTIALVDTGATFSFLPFEIAESLGIRPQGLTGQLLRLRGIGPTMPARFAVLKIEVLDDLEPKSFEMPFATPLEPEVRPGPDRIVTPHPVVLGRHPFMDRFRLILDQGPSPRDGVPEWTLEEI